MLFRANAITFKTHHHQSGLSLIELMVSITIGLLVLVTLSTLFVNQSSTRTELDKSNRMIENGRYALDLLSDNLRLAGFYGAYDSGNASAALIATPPNPCSSNPAHIRDALPFYVQGYNTNVTSDIASPPTCLPSTIKTGSDVLVIRRAGLEALPAASAVSDTRYLQVSQCQFEASNSFLLLTAPATYNLSKKACTTANSGPAADLRSIRVQIYFIDTNNKPNDGVPTLKMVELIDKVTYPYSTYNSGSFTPAIPLVEGVEYMQVDYGVDTNDDGAPDSYVSTPAGTTVSNWSKVVSAKINIVSRNLDTTNSYTDSATYRLGTGGTVTPGGHYKRHAYTQVVRLINPAGRKE